MRAGGRRRSLARRPHVAKAKPWRQIDKTAVSPPAPARLFQQRPARVHGNWSLAGRGQPAASSRSWTRSAAGWLGQQRLAGSLAAQPLLRIGGRRDRGPRLTSTLAVQRRQKSIAAIMLGKRGQDIPPVAGRREACACRSQTACTRRPIPLPFLAT